MQFNRGEILYDKQFIYPGDTLHCDKLLLVVNKNHKNPEDIVLIPATTHKNYYKYKEYCNKTEKIFYIEKQIGFYYARTIVQLYLIDLFSYKGIIDKINSGQVVRINKSTSQQEFGLIINCLKQLKDDIEFYIQDLIF